MLGLAPISSRSISGGTFKLFVVPLAVISSVTVDFAIDGRMGAFNPMLANIPILFSGSPTLWVDQYISGTGSITFGGNPTLRVAGKPLIVTALPFTYTVRASRHDYTLKASHERFTVRGVR